MIDVIRLRATDPKVQCKFYTEILGMQKLHNGAFGYSNGQACIAFEPADSPYQDSNTNVYWKFSLAVPNINLAYQQLVSHNVEVSEPHQFEDIGYMMHLRDPEGFQIELLDHNFKGDRKENVFDENLFGGGAHLNLLTLRTHDIASVDKEMKNIGMAPLAIMPVTVAGFVLYFYAFTKEKPPHADLYAVENRTWLYQRPYTVLEVVHRPESSPMEKTPAMQAGYAGSTIAGAQPESYRFSQLLITGRGA